MMPFAARTHPGLQRSRNEDCFAANPALGLWIVADGLGGHSNGEVASAIACDAIVRHVGEGASLTTAINCAHQAVLQEIRRRDSDSNMGTTVVALRLDNDAYEVAWVGDSRAYLFDGHLTQLTSDHSAVNELVKSGAIEADQAARHPQRHALSRSLGVSDKNDSDASVVSGILRDGQIILLCTDGVTDELGDIELMSQLRINGNLEDRAEALVQAALARGGRDNLTLVLVEKKQAELRAQSSLDLETTQNIGEPNSAPIPRSSNWRGAIFAITAALAAALLGLWLLY